jgi:hypothetical protein
MIWGQCMQVLLDKMKHDLDWNSTSESYDPLTLLKLIEKTILAQTEDQYPYATVYRHFQFSESMPNRLLQGVRRKRRKVPHGIPGVSHETGTMFHQAFERHNTDVLFKQNHGKGILLDLRNIILLDSQSMMDLFCNPKLVHNISRASNKMRLQSNGGSMTVNHKATMAGYKKKVWFSKDAITNIIALSNLIQQYHVTYDSKRPDIRGPQRRPE